MLKKLFHKSLQVNEVEKPMSDPEKTKPKKKGKWRTLSVIRVLADKADVALQSGKYSYENVPDLISCLLRDWLKERGYLKD